MARMAIISNGVVVNVILAEAWPGAVPCGNTVSIGWTYANGTFTAPSSQVNSMYALNCTISEGAAVDANLEHCVVTGNGAAARTRGRSSTIIGIGAAVDADIELSEVRGQYAAHKAWLRDTVVDGYAACEYAHAERSSFHGQYAGHSCYGTKLVAIGNSALSAFIGARTIAKGEYAGDHAEGEDLVFLGDNTNTARVPGPQKLVNEIYVNTPEVHWGITAHGFGPPGTRVNLFVYGDVMPTTQSTPFVNGQIRPFVVISENRIQYAGNKYRATTTGSNVRVASNTCRPKRSVAIGYGSIITGDDQVIINGMDMTGIVTRVQALEAAL